MDGWTDTLAGAGALRLDWIKNQIKVKINHNGIPSAIDYCVCYRSVGVHIQIKKKNKKKQNKKQKKKQNQKQKKKKKKET